MLLTTLNWIASYALLSEETEETCRSRLDLIHQHTQSFSFIALALEL